jgi:hypothetical protein
LAGQSVDLTIPPSVDASQCDPPIGLQIWLDRSGNQYLPLDLAEFEAIMTSIKVEP